MSDQLGTQCERIAKYLTNIGPITALEALDLFGCFRLAARIKDLKEQGMNIKSVPFKTRGGATIAKYYLEKDEKPLSQAEFELGNNQ